MEQKREVALSLSNQAANLQKNGCYTVLASKFAIERCPDVSVNMIDKIHDLLKVLLNEKIIDYSEEYIDQIGDTPLLFFHGQRKGTIEVEILQENQHFILYKSLFDSKAEYNAIKQMKAIEVNRFVVQRDGEYVITNYTETIDLKLSNGVYAVHLYIDENRNNRAVAIEKTV